MNNEKSTNNIIKNLPLKRDQFTKKIITMRYNSFYEMAFTCKKFDKLIADMRIIISAILEILRELDASAKFIYYEEIPKRTPLTLSIEEEKVITIPPKSLNHLQYFFHNLKKKLKGGHQYVKCHLLHSTTIENIYKTLKNEHTKFKLWLQP